MRLARRSLQPFYVSLKQGSWAILLTLSEAGTELGPSNARFRNVVWGGARLMIRQKPG